MFRKVTLNEISQCFIISEKEFIANNDCYYLVNKEFENIIEIVEIKRTMKHICNFPLIVMLETGEEVETYIMTNTLLTTRFDSMEEDADNYILKVKAGQQLFDSNVFIKAVGNASSLFFLLISGKIGDTGGMDYNEIYQLVYDTLNDNEITGKPSIAYELLVSEILRDKKDLGKPFRLVANETNLKNGFQAINIREIPRMQSPVSALMSEDIFDGVVSIVNSGNSGKKANLTPVEQIMLNKY
jgi:hypothetical protein